MKIFPKLKYIICVVFLLGEKFTTKGYYLYHRQLLVRARGRRLRLIDKLKSGFNL